MLLLCLLCPVFVTGGHSLTEKGEDEPAIEETRLVLGIVPQYLFANGLRTDLDIRITANHWLQLAPVAFLGNELQMSQAVTRIRGAGLHASHRFYPGKGYGVPAVYLAWGPMVHYTTLHYPESLPQGSTDRYTSIHKTGIDLVFGVHTRLVGLLLIDFYGGMGLRHSFRQSDAVDMKRFDESFVDFGYSGNILLLGVRFGLSIK